MGALFGFLSALGIGLADIFNRRVVAASSTLTTVVAVQIPAVVTVLATLMIVDSTVLWADLVRGGFSGLGVGGGVALYYGGLSRSSSAVVAPVVGTLVAVLPFTYASITDQAPSLVAVLGAFVAFLGLAVVAAGGRRAERVRSGLRWGAASGICYGVGLSALVDADEASGAWPIVSQRVVAFSFLATLACFAKVAIVPPREVLLAATAGGISFGLAGMFYLLGLHADAVPSVVTSSMFPAVAVAVGFFLFRDAITRIQVAGIALTLLGVAAVVYPA